MPAGDSLIKAAGAVLWRANGSNPADPVDPAGPAEALEVALVHRPRYDDWSLPKGKLARGENPLAGAAREVSEETGHRVALGRHLGRVNYVVSSPLAKVTGPKVVDYWAARALEGVFRPNAEVDELRWVSPTAARDILTYDYDRTMLDSFTALPVPTATVLLVRHAKAGERAQWHGDDDLRPLTKDGQRQAAALGLLLLLFRPSPVYSAPRVRCVQTVEPLARELGVEIIEEPLLSEENYVANRAAGRRRLLEIAGTGATSVVCSQGGVIPDVVYSLAGEAAAGADGEVPSKKGSTWVLSLRGTQCLAADYYGPPL
jgi:8-oxo-(d)GTP phosphatase